MKSADDNDKNDDNDNHDDVHDDQTRILLTAMNNDNKKKSGAAVPHPHKDFPSLFFIVLQCP